MLSNLHENNKDDAKLSMKRIKHAAINNKNIFEQMMEVSKTCSLGQITNALFQVGGQYRRNM